MKIPRKIRIGGQELTVECPEKLDGSKLGTCCLCAGYIKIARNCDGNHQTESSQMNTFLHETVHGILDTMGRSDLSRDETFVCSFAGFLTEMMYSWEADGTFGATK